MVKHISLRLAWHMDGWNGHICRKPKENPYCVGPYSYPGDVIKHERNLDWESEATVAGCHCSKLDDFPPCAYSINAFGSEPMKARANTPLWWGNEAEAAIIDIPPSTACVWPYKGMYSDDVLLPEEQAQTYDYPKRLENARKYFKELQPDKALIFYYANFSNPFSEEDEKRYVIIGISRLKKAGDIHYFTKPSDRIKRKYAGGFVWQVPVTSHYPDQGFVIPYHKYMDNPSILNSIAVFPENRRACQYGSVHVSDDDAIAIVEDLVTSAEQLIQIGDDTQNWQLRIEWLNSLISELWNNRGAYPSFHTILTSLQFNSIAQYYKDMCENHQELEAYLNIKQFLAKEKTDIDGVSLKKAEKDKILRTWQLINEDARNLFSLDSL